jgi:hypothetical protein
MGKAAFHGILGDVVMENDPYTESDSSAVLIQSYVLVGSCIGRGPHAYADSVRHGVNENVLIAGDTSDGRKGTAYANARQFITPADSEWATHCIKSGLSSGEGLVFAVRDASDIDVGVVDKRLCVVETEFASVLKQMSRRGSVLSELIRVAWDGGDLNLLTKNNPCRATGPHISTIAHSTRSDLRRHLEDTDACNGFLNRFLICHSRRSKLLPESRSMPQEQFQSLAAGVAGAISFATRVGLMQRDEAAKRLWDAAYEGLTSAHPGIYGSLSARGAAHVLRLSMICAAMDRSHYIRREHLEAALEIWRYCCDSIRFVFGDAVGDRLTDTVLNSLRANPAGMSRNDLFQMFGRNQPAARIENALKNLEHLRMARSVPSLTNTKGRTPEIWIAVNPRETKQ